MLRIQAQILARFAFDIFQLLCAFGQFFFRYVKMKLPGRHVDFYNIPVHNQSNRTAFGRFWAGVSNRQAGGGSRETAIRN
ncbi:hypothetical protein D3C74_427530 [compost metagenome]